MNCIFCDKVVEKNSEEHIVPESLGNEKYILKSGAICGACNNSFSKFEEKALSSTVIGMERTRLGVVTKKGKPAVAQSGDFKFTGNEEFKKNFITVQGLKPQHIRNFNLATRTFQIAVPGFEKGQMATAKFLLKVGLESLFQSQRGIFSKFAFKELKQYLSNESNIDWPFLTAHNKLSGFVSIPRFIDKYLLKKIHCHLEYLIVSDEALIFKFNYGAVQILINLLGRDIKWMEEYIKADKNATVYPEHKRTKKI